jgi:hypothetical protein
VSRFWTIDLSGFWTTYVQFLDMSDFWTCVQFLDICSIILRLFNLRILLSRFRTSRFQALVAHPKAMILLDADDGPEAAGPLGNHVAQRQRIQRRGHMLATNATHGTNLRGRNIVPLFLVPVGLAYDREHDFQLVSSEAEVQDAVVQLIRDTNVAIIQLRRGAHPSEDALCWRFASRIAITFASIEV